MPPLRVLVASAPGAGKTTLCKRAHERLKTMLPAGTVSGFLSREVSNSKGFKIGYELYSVAGDLSETVASSEGPESRHMVAKYNVYVDALDRVAIPALDEVLAATGSRVCIIDDIGNITTKSDSLVDRVRKVLVSKDPGLHVLAALGMGNSGFILDARKIEGVKTQGIDESTRDSILDSLTARFLRAASEDPTEDASSDEGDDELEDNDFTIFDQWGGDQRRLGVKRGMYDPKVSQEALLSRETKDHPLSRDGAPAKMDRVEKSQQSQSSTRWTSEPQKQSVTEFQKPSTSTPATPEHGKDAKPDSNSYVKSDANGYANGSRSSAAVGSSYSNGEANDFRSSGMNNSGNYNANGYRNNYVNGYGNHGYGNSYENGYAAKHSSNYFTGTESPAADANSMPYGLTSALRLWLDALDPDGFLCEYATDLGKLKITSPDEAVARYAKDGVLSSQFFADAGIKKLGHRRLFERWFKESAQVLRAV